MSFPAVIHTGETVQVTEKGYAPDGETEIYVDEDGNEYTRDSNNDPHILTPLEKVEDDVKEIVHEGGTLVADAIALVTGGKTAKTVEELAAAAAAYDAANGGDTAAAKTVTAGIEAGTIKLAAAPAANSWN